MDKSPAQMVEEYIKLRDYKKAADDAFKKQMERVNLGMEKLSNMMLAYLSESGADSISCPAGTVYRNTQYTATVEDKEAFKTWLQETGEWEALDLRANKTYVRESMTEGNIVPGVKLSSFNTVGVRRS